MSKAATSTVATKTAYEGSVIIRAMERGGRNPHLKGHIQEILVKDAHNMRHLLARNGATTELTKSTTARAVDLVTTKGGRVVGRIQVKDVTSKAGIDKLVQQCADGKYRSVKLVGSEETTELFNKAAKEAGLSKRMTSSGMSSRSTEALAQRAGAAGSGTLGRAVARSALTGGVAGGVVGAGVEVIKGGIDLFNGEADVIEVGGRVVMAGAKGGTVGAASGAAATVGGAAAAAGVSALGLSGAAATALTIGAPLVVAAGAGFLAASAFDAACDFLSDLF